MFVDIISIYHTFRDMHLNTDRETLEAIIEELIESGEAFNSEFIIKYHDEDFKTQRELTELIYDMDFSRWGRVFFDHASPRELEYLIQNAGKYRLDKAALQAHYQSTYCE